MHSSEGHSRMQGVFAQLLLVLVYVCLEGGANLILWLLPLVPTQLQRQRRA